MNCRKRSLTSIQSGLADGRGRTTDGTAAAASTCTIYREVLRAYKVTSKGNLEFSPVGSLAL